LVTKRIFKLLSPTTEIVNVLVTVALLVSDVVTTIDKLFAAVIVKLFPLVYAPPLIVIVDVAEPPSTTVNLILDAVDATHPVTAPVVSVPPTAGIATLVTPPTGLTLPTDKVIDEGAVAIAISLIVTEVLVASTVPLVLPERIEAVNVSAPSVMPSAVGVTENDPLLLVIVNDPEKILNSTVLSSIVQ
jgi:hypothetical protein